MSQKVILVANQKGGICKTTVAASLSVYYAKLGQKVLLADMDFLQQSTSIDWYLQREKKLENLTVKEFRTVKALGAMAAGYDMVIIDGAPHASGLTLELAEVADKVIIPTCTPMIDLKPSARLGFELKNAGIEDIQFALIKTLSDAEAISAIAGLEEQAFDVSKVWLQASIGFANAMDSGLGLQETSHWSLRKKGKAFIDALVI